MTTDMRNNTSAARRRRFRCDRCGYVLSTAFTRCVLHTCDGHEHAWFLPAIDEEQSPTAGAARP